MHRRVIAALFALSLLVTACSPEFVPIDDVPSPPETVAPTAPDVALSAGCSAAFAAATSVTDAAEANPLIVDTLSACRTADEWYAGLRESPAAFGLTESAVIGQNDMELRNACYGNEGDPVCVDAAQQGRI